MELHEFTADTFQSLTLPWEEILLGPLGDNQAGARGYDRPKFQRHVKWLRKHNGYTTLMGDALDLASPSNRAKLEAAGIYDTTWEALDRFAYQLLEEYLEDIEPMRGRCLMVCKGHHLWKFKEGKYKGYDSDDVIADFLGCPVTDELGAGITQITFKTASGKHSQRCQVFQWHGNGNAGTLTGIIQKIQKIANGWPSADVVLVGHMPIKHGWAEDHREPYFGKRPMLRDKRRILASTGGFCRSYEVGGTATYAEKGGMISSNIGGVMIRIRPLHEETHDRLDMNVEN